VRWSARLLDRASGERVDNHSSKTRWTFRKLDRKCVEAFDGDVELETATAVDHVDAFIADSLGIIRNTYQAALPIGVKDNPEYRELLREMAEAGALRGYLLRGGGQPLAYVLGDRWGTTFSLWATAFLPDHRRLSPGIVTLRRVMDSLASEGVAVFDFGWGEAEYKKKLGDHRADETDYSLYAKRVVPMLAFAAQRGTKLARARLNQLARRLGVRDRVRAARRRLMTRP
jgi:CelD/BcsL family acetyltransferase involved in cellulose biosynthesis